MSATPPDRAELDRIAGVSRRAPRVRYEVEGLSFGGATLTRRADDRWSLLTLSLTAEAAVRTEAPGTTSVEFPMEYWLAQGATYGDGEATITAGLHALLVEHHLLSRPALLQRPDDGGPPVEGAAREALVKLREAVERTHAQYARCPACDAARRDHPPSVENLDLLARVLGRRIDPAQLRDLLGGAYPTRRGVARPCAHAAMRVEALRALCAAYPELALESAHLLIGASSLDPPRFVLSPMAEKPMLGQWLVQRARRRRGYGYDDYLRDAPPRRRVSLRRPVGDTPLSPALRGALSFAAQSWEADGPLEGFAPPPEGATEAAPTMSASTEVLDVAVLWPDGATHPAPTIAAEPEAPKVAPKPKRPRAPKAPAKPTQEPSPGQELMTADLRALGYTDARIKQLLKDGVIERAGYGWFRWKGAPPGPAT